MASVATRAVEVCPSDVVWLLSLAARRVPSGENASAWIASLCSASGVRSEKERTYRGVESTFHSCTTPPCPPTASSPPLDDQASAVIASPVGLIVNDASCRRVRVANTPTDDGPVATANRSPSG